MPKPPRDVARLSFEEALSELEALVQKLEQGEVRLEDSLKLYRRGEALKRRCAELLKEAQIQIEQLTPSGAPAGGEPASAPPAADAPKTPPDGEPSV